MAVMSNTVFVDFGVQFTPLAIFGLVSRCLYPKQDATTTLIAETPFE